MEMDKETIVNTLSNIINLQTEIDSCGCGQNFSVYETIPMATTFAKMKEAFGELAKYVNLEEDEATLTNHYSRFETLSNAILQTTCNESEQMIAARLIIYSLLRIKPFSELKILPSIDTEGRFSYSRNADDTDSTRVSTTFGRVIRRQLIIPSESIRDDLLAKLSEIIVQRLWDPSPNIVELTGNSILRAYENYGGPSCMNGDRCLYMEVCAHNPDKVTMLVAYNENNVGVAKALLWITDQDDLFLDRVYHHDMYHSKGTAIVGYARKSGANIPENPFAGRLNSGRTVTLDFSKCKHVPYLDSFVGVVKQDKELKEVVLSTDSVIDLQSTRGRGIYCCGKCGRKHIGRICPECKIDQVLWENRDEIECTSCGTSEISSSFIENNRILYACDECIGRYYHECRNCGRLMRDSDSSLCQACI